uniref:NADH-ubiquinone oxidoreductase chain 6 n=1 Tax=Pseudotrapelus sinaitus TaxID=118229 RepID=D1MV85_9SAUR|nr:NADH dehydrogenase subunit 6 [Pseudotrapelus sinaitus]BAI52999.1 NADH dsehydrogenase subunit 6 [Pseudotrapelus sinaitus]
MYFVLLLVVVFMVGVVGVVSNPAPCFGALLLVLVSGVVCGIVAEVGVAFAALVLFLIYLGGMLVVFAYSVSLCSDLYPEVFGGQFVWLSLLFFMVSCVLLRFELGEAGFGEEGVGMGCQFDSGHFGVPLLYSLGGFSLLIVGFGLLLTLVVVVELVRGVAFVSQKSD